MDLNTILKKIEDSEKDMIKAMSDMIRIPAIGPMNGGTGESERADMLMGLLDGFEVERIDLEDANYPGVMRPNILARKKGEGKGTVWIVAHTDTVLPGDITEWDTPPYEPTMVGRKLHGLGAEDNGQSVIASIFGAKFLNLGKGSRRSIGLALVADEETTNRMGMESLVKMDVFKEGDVVIVPDGGAPDGSIIQIAEKHLIWLKFTIKGKQTHGSMPIMGLNAFTAGSRFLVDLVDRLRERYSEKDPMFLPEMTTFEPTKAMNTAKNVNTVPGYSEFYMDIRMLPSQDPDEMIEFARQIAKEHEASSGAKIDVEMIQRTYGGRPSRTDTDEYRALAESVRSVIGKEPSVIGVGGGTCANFIRLKNRDAYVWQTSASSMHQPNEYCDIDNLITDAKVYATLFHRLCV